MNTKVAILLTTFKRDKLLFQTIKSIFDNWVNNYVLIVGDQGEDNKEKTKFIEENFDGVNTIYHKQDFDIGLSASRNDLVKRAKELGIRYCIITADSVMFTEKYPIEDIVGFMRTDPRIGTVGFKLENRVPWNCDLELIPEKYFLFDAPKRPIRKFKKMNFQQVDCHVNFFIARTEALLHTPWREELKLTEHAPHDWDWKNNPYLFDDELYQPWLKFYTESIVSEYVGYKPKGYKEYRLRAMNKFRQKAQKIYGIKGWHKYTEDLQKVFQNYRTNKRKRNAKNK